MREALKVRYKSNTSFPHATTAFLIPVIADTNLYRHCCHVVHPQVIVIPNMTACAILPVVTANTTAKLANGNLAIPVTAAGILIPLSL